MKFTSDIEGLLFAYQELVLYKACIILTTIAHISDQSQLPKKKGKINVSLLDQLKVNVSLP